jgi:uncharacterized membrane protein YqaE (UPF0057 family)
MNLVLGFAGVMIVVGAFLMEAPGISIVSEFHISVLHYFLSDELPPLAVYFVSGFLNSFLITAYLIFFSWLLFFSGLGGRLYCYVSDNILSGIRSLFADNTRTVHVYRARHEWEDESYGDTFEQDWHEDDFSSEQRTYSEDQYDYSDEPEDEYFERREGAEDFYQILGVLRGATEAEIKAAYREKIKKFHPDKVDGMDSSVKDFCAEQTKLVNKAYEALLKTAKNSRHAA